MLYDGIRTQYVISCMLPPYKLPTSVSDIKSDFKTIFVILSVLSFTKQMLWHDVAFTWHASPIAFIFSVSELRSQFLKGTQSVKLPLCFKRSYSSQYLIGNQISNIRSNSDFGRENGYYKSTVIEFCAGGFEHFYSACNRISKVAFNSPDIKWPLPSVNIVENFCILQTTDDTT